MRILIVGAGPTGTALSLLLARRGVHVVLLDREVNFDRVFRGEALMPSGVEAIAQMGLRDEFARLPQRTVECMEFYVEGARIIRAEWPEIKAANAVHIVSQPALIEMLTSAAAGYPTFEMRLGALVRDVEVTDDGVELRVQRADAEETLHGDVVVSADGRASSFGRVLASKSNGCRFLLMWHGSPCRYRRASRKTPASRPSAGAAGRWVFILRGTGNFDSVLMYRRVPPVLAGRRRAKMPCLMKPGRLWASRTRPSFASGRMKSPSR